MNAKPQVTIHTDGACIGNPGPGGYGVVLQFGEKRKELSGGYRLTTNNRMELLGPIEALQTLKKSYFVILYSDSRYVVDAIQKGWAEKWRANNWMRNKKERAVNPDLWRQLLTLCAEHEIEFRWVRGHAGNPGNERCDQLATQAARQKGLPIDGGYESQAMVQPRLK